MGKPKHRLTNGELEILRVFWSAGKCSVRDVHDALSAKRPIALTTVATRIGKMDGKKLIESVDDRRPKQYKASVELDSTAGSMVGDVLERVFGGSAARMVLHLLNRKQLSADEKRAVQERLDKMR